MKPYWMSLGQPQAEGELWTGRPVVPLEGGSTLPVVDLLYQAKPLSPPAAKARPWCPASTPGQRDWVSMSLSSTGSPHPLWSQVAQDTSGPKSWQCPKRWGAEVVAGEWVRPGAGILSSVSVFPPVLDTGWCRPPSDLEELHVGIIILSLLPVSLPINAGEDNACFQGCWKGPMTCVQPFP